jgi:acetylglutamate kinase
VAEVHPPLVVKIGGSTLGEADTTFADIALLQREARQLVAVHGGGAEITRWLKRLAIGTRFVRGRRVTDEASLEAVVAVLGGVVNKQIVADITAVGGRAAGISGVDGGLLSAAITDWELGLVGEVQGVDAGVLRALLAAGYVPVVAPIGLAGGQIVNINADTAAGAIAAALKAESLVFLTDVEAVLDGDKNPLTGLTAAEAQALIDSGVADGGMVPKLEAALIAASAGATCRILDGRQPGALLRAASGEPIGTLIAS